MHDEKRRHTRYWEKSVRLYFKDGNLKERIEVVNMSHSGLCFELPTKIKVFEIGDRTNLLFQVGNEITVFSITIHWTSDHFKKLDKYDVLRYGAKTDWDTFTNSDLWEDYITYLSLKKRFLLPEDN